MIKTNLLGLVIAEHLCQTRYEWATIAAHQSDQAAIEAQIKAIDAELQKPTGRFPDKMKTYIVRFKGTPPNHYDAAQPRLIEARDKESAIDLAHALAKRDGWEVSSVRKYFGHEIPAHN